MADAQYLQETVGPALTAGLASCASAQPDDPVDYLAHWLLKYLAVQEKKAMASEAEEVVKKEHEALDAAEQAKVDAEAAKVHKLQEAKAAIEACTNIPMFYERIVKGVRENTKANNVYVALLEPVSPEEDLDAGGAPASHDDELEDVWEEDTREAPAEGEEPLPEWVPPKVLPVIPKYSKLRYVFASEGNEWLRGKELRSPACQKSKDASTGGGGGRETVSFRAVHERSGRVIRNVLESDPMLHFFDMPMPGSFACQTLLRGETNDKPEGKNYLAGGVMGILCCDTVDFDGVLDEKDGVVFTDLSATASVTYERLLEEARQRQIQEDELARKLLEEDIVLPTGEAAEGEEPPPPNPEACLAPEEGDDNEKEIEALEAEIATLSANLDLTNSEGGRIALVKKVIKECVPETKSNEHGREIPDLAVGAVDFEANSVGHRVVKATAKLVSASDISDLKETAADFAAAIQAFDIKTVTQDTLAAINEELEAEPAITTEAYATLPFQARLLFVLIVVAKELSSHSIRLAEKQKIKQTKEEEKAAAEAAAAAEAKAAEEAAAAEAAGEGGEAAPPAE